MYISVCELCGEALICFPAVARDRSGWRLSRGLHKSVYYLSERHVLHQTGWFLQQVEYHDSGATLHGSKG